MSLVFGLFIFALGVVLILRSKLGLSPWDVLNQGLAKHTFHTFGTANIAVAVVVLFIAWSLGGKPWIGTVANAILIGSFIQALTSLGWLTRLQHDGLDVRIALLVLGIVIPAIGTAFYIGADLGAGPRDTLMLVGARRTRFRIGIVRAVLELTALVVGIVLGGAFGVGTVAFALGIGPCIEASLALLERSPLAVAVARRPSLEPPAVAAELHPR